MAKNYVARDFGCGFRPSTKLSSSHPKQIILAVKLVAELDLRALNRYLKRRIVTVQSPVVLVFYIADGDLASRVFTMAQNKYDDSAFFNEFMHLPSQMFGLQGAPEWPLFRSLLPHIQGCKVLDLGCGQGWTCRWAREMGAMIAHGVDISEKMLANARKFLSDPSIEYEHSDLETVELPTTNYNLVISSLALHYVEHLPDVFAQVFKTLTPGGTFVFSVEHPLYTSPTNPEWNKDEKAPPLDDYLFEGQRCTNWLTEGVIKQHHTFATYINFLIEAGFAIGYVVEWGPNKEQAERSWQLADHRNRPRFLILKATKPTARWEVNGQIEAPKSNGVVKKEGSETAPKMNCER